MITTTFHPITTNNHIIIICSRSHLPDMILTNKMIWI